MTSVFDPAAFEQSATSSDANSTSITPVPEGPRNAVIEDYKFRSIESEKRPGESFIMCDVQFAIIDDTGELEAAIGRPPKVTQGYFVDTDKNGAMDMSKGKNVWLGKLREAINQNTPGVPWSIAMIKGQPCQIVVTQEPSKKDDAIYNRVKTVGRIA